MIVPATKQAIVYQATNRVNGKRYIGYTARGLAVRRSQHFSIARKGGGNHFQNALRKHGEDNFSFVVLGEFGDDEELAKVYEIEAIAKYRPEYNLSYGGEGGTLHESSRKKIGEANRGRPAHNKGVSLTEEHKQKIRAALKVKQPSREALSKPVKCLTDGRVFVSANEADRFYGLPLGSASRFARGQNKSKQGFRFEYVVKK